MEPGISEDALTLLTRYVALLGVPAQRSVPSGFPKGVAPLPYLDVNPAQVAAGSKVFDDTKCSRCHVREMTTGTTAELAYYGMRELELTDPDGNRLRIGTPAAG